MLRSLALTLIACFITASSCIGHPTRLLIRDVESMPLLQKGLPFKIVLPKYLPEGFKFSGASLGVFNDEVNKFVDMNYSDEAGRDIRIEQGVPLRSESFPIKKRWEYKYLKNARIQVEYESLTLTYMPDGSTTVMDGVQVVWVYDGVSFYLRTTGVPWDEVEGVIDSMIE